MTLAAVLPPAIRGSRKRGLTITWTDDDNLPVDLTGAVLSGWKRKANSQEAAVAIDGALAVLTAAAGTFTWALGALDVGTVGVFDIQFIATYPDTLKSKTYEVDFEVLEALG